MAIRWAILGAARIAATRFIPAAQVVGGQLSVVAGRDIGRARRFAESHAIPHAVSNYQAAIERPDVDAVYIALPNSLHREWTERALLAGKAVLCEKPLAMTPADAQAITAASRRSGVSVWESFAFAHQAQTRRVRQLLAAGAIGTVGAVVGRFHFTLDDPSDIRWQAALGGGALLDVGCYLAQWGRGLLGTPTDAQAWARYERGVDAEIQFVLAFATGATMFADCGFAGQDDTSMVFYGSRGRLALTNPWHPGPADTLTVSTSEAHTVDCLGVDHSFAPMLEHIHTSLQTGTASPHAASHGLAEQAALLDALSARGRQHSGQSCAR